MAEVSMSLEEYESLRSMALNGSCMNCEAGQISSEPMPKPKRKRSAYNRRYAAAFKKVQSRFKKKNGGWMKDGFKRAQREAHKIARRGNRKR